MYYQVNGNKVRFFIDCGFGSNGKKAIKSHQITLPEGLSKKEMKRIIKETGEEFERKIRGGSTAFNDRLKFKDFVNGIYEKNHLSTLKPKTAQDYRAIIRDRLNYFDEMLLIDITPIDVRKWLAQLDRTDGSAQPLSENSKGIWFRTLSAIMGKAEDWELIESNPCKKVKQPRKPQSDVKALEQAEVDKVFNNFENFDDIRIVIMMKIFILTGMRYSECSGLEWGDVDFDDCTIRIVRESIYVRGKGVVESTPKSKSSRRIICIPMSLAEDLKEYKAIQEQWIEERGDLWVGEKGDKAKLFTQFDGKPVNSSTFNFWVRKYLDWCGVPYVPPHALRHTFASLLISHGVDASAAAAQLGHSSPSLVYNTYANPQEAAKRNSARLLEEITSKKSSSEV